MDGGATWFAVNNGLTNLSNPTAYVVAEELAINPQEPSILYLRTGNSGIHKTTDGGSSWVLLSTALDARAIAIDPQTPDTLYVGTLMYGIYKSMDGGASWFPANNGLVDPIDPIPNATVKCLAIDPQTPSTLYAGTWARTVFKSVDGGQSWFSINNGLPQPQQYSEVHALGIDPKAPNILYAAMAGGVFKSLDGGGAWFPVRNGLSDLEVNALAIDPLNPSTVYAASACVGVSKSTNGGSNWSTSNKGLSNLAIIALAIDPLTPTTIYAGSSCVGVSKSIDGGASWIESKNGLVDPKYPDDRLDVKCLAIDPLTPTTLYAGTFRLGVYKSMDAGASWSSVSNGLPVDSSVTSIAVNPTIPTTIYAQTETVKFNGFRPYNETASYKSTDGGNNWLIVPAPEWGYPMFVSLKRPLIIDPSETNTLYLGAAGSVSKSTDGGTTWFSVYSGLPSSQLYVVSLAIDPRTPNTLYMGANNGVFKSIDGGASWFAVDSPQHLTTALAVDPLTTNNLYMATYGNGVYKSEDAGSSWADFNGGLTTLNVNTLAIDPLTPTIIYSGTGAGVYKYEAVVDSNVAGSDGGGNGSGCFINSVATSRFWEELW
jgi:photosystem II stability/assembly factor-like uncharacterized protein